MPAHTPRTQEGLGVWPVAPPTPGQRDTGRGLPLLALSMPSALLPLPVSIKNCSAALLEAWTGAGVGFRWAPGALLSNAALSRPLAQAGGWAAIPLLAHCPIP